MAFALHPDTLWVGTYEGLLGSEIGRSGQQTVDGGYIIAGYTCYGVLQSDAYLVKTDALGDAVWTKTYGIAGSGYEDCLISVCQTSDGGYIAVGFTNSFGAGAMDIWLMKIDANGDTVWTKTFGGIYNDWGYSVQPTADGGYIIAGSTVSYGAGGSCDVYLIKTDASGNAVWTRTYGLAGRAENGFSVRQTSDGGYIVAGCADGQYADVYLVKTAANGDTLWTKTYGDPNLASCGWSVQQTSDGGYIIAGSTQRDTEVSMDVCLIKTNQNGDQQWFKQYGGDVADEGYSVCQTVNGGYIVAGFTGTMGSTDVYLIKTDANGDTCWTKTYGGIHSDGAWAVQQTSDQGYAVVGYTRLSGELFEDMLLMRLTPDSLLTDDNAALAYNGNKHLVRQPNSSMLHLVYSFEGHMLYTRSTDIGDNWSALENLGQGILPAITLDFAGNPCVTWTDVNGALFYSKKTGSTWQYYELYYPVQPADPVVNSPPAITISPGDDSPMIQIIATFTGRSSEEYVTHEVRHYYFNSDNPTQTYTIIETAIAPATPLRRHSPTIVRNEIDNWLHAAWMRVDTICYARKTATGSWVKYGNPFDAYGRNSAFPFIESYGDSIYLVWQNKASPTSPEEIWRGRRPRVQVRWYWWNHSLTPSTVSCFPVNASGLFTAFMDKEESQMSFDVFFKIRSTDPLTNISQTAGESYYPQAVAWFTPFGNHLYTMWLEGNNIPYEIRLKDTFMPYFAGNEIAFLSSFSGDSVMSPYLTARDGYKPDWQVPVDYGNQQLTYRLPLDPAYVYKAKVIAYHEKVSEWRALCKVDGGNQMLIKYNPHTPETLTFWIPPSLYQDSVLDVTLSRVAGDFVSMGPIYVYRYEQEPGGNGGPQSRIDTRLEDDCIQMRVQPNPVRDEFTVAYFLSEMADVKLTIYDAAGRVVTVLSQGVQMPGAYCESVPRLDAPQGIYFIRLVAGDTAVVEKVVFLR